MKYLLGLFLAFFLTYHLPKFCYEKTGGFKMGNIRSDIPSNPAWEISSSPKEDLEPILNQRFTYFAAGGQCYAFISDDGQYVLKFFKFHRRRLPLWLRTLPLPANFRAKRAHQLAKRKRKLERDLSSYHLAFHQFSEESGLVFVHINPSNQLHQKARIVDKLHIEHTVDLDSTPFILQKRADPAFSYLKHLVETGEIEAAKEAVESICKLILTRCEKGIYDEDAKIHRNFGFIKNRAILIDVGRLKPDKRRKHPDVQLQDLKKITHRLEHFLQEISPELAEHLDAHLNTLDHRPLLSPQDRRVSPQQA